ncbi:MsnO8 family LLM class oxidoreductase [Oceanobacter kriegii]|uniref:MsnO8 family LLM class oxidoreductase n=1 Tax=Oceanobacter kriegii TaxID=64972 RepID=UPI00040AB210|nr:MsnO8 family LLM class oxidoreductase [Oceanobacter kriegii]
MTLKISIVDQSPVHGSHPKIDAPSLTLELAQLADRSGYHRYWVAEHHDSVHFANPCPEILVATIAAQTKNLRVGSGGVMLSHYSPLKVAETFSMLANLHPGRIDLGVGRAPGGSHQTTTALAFPYRPNNGELYASQATQLVDFIHSESHTQGGGKWNPFAAIRVLPDASRKPQLWMLGSSGGSAELAGRLGYDLALARFIDPDGCSPEVFQRYDQARRDAGHSPSAGKMLAVACICADTDEEARLRAGTAVYRKLAAQLGQREDFLTPSEVQNRYKALSLSQQSVYDHILTGYTVGSPSRCYDELHRLADQYQCEEITTVTVTHSQAERLHSYELLATNW